MIDFMYSVERNIKIAYQIQNIAQSLQQDFLMQGFEQYLKTNKFKRYLDYMSDLLRITVESYVHHKYHQSDIRVFKNPETGVLPDLNFSLYGNDEYEQLLKDRYVEKGNIISSREQLSIIAKPREAARAQELLFRTSKGETIKADSYIGELIRSFMLAHSPVIQQNYDNDVHSYISRITAFRI